MEVFLGAQKFLDAFTSHSRLRCAKCIRIQYISSRVLFFCDLHVNVRAFVVLDQFEGLLCVTFKSFVTIRGEIVRLKVRNSTGFLVLIFKRSVTKVKYTIYLGIYSFSFYYSNTGFSIFFGGVFSGVVTGAYVYVMVRHCLRRPSRYRRAVTIETPLVSTKTFRRCRRDGFCVFFYFLRFRFAHAFPSPDWHGSIKPQTPESSSKNRTTDSRSDVGSTHFG